MPSQLYGPGVPTQYNNIQQYTNAVAAFKNGTVYQPTVANKALGGQGGTPTQQTAAPTGGGGGSNNTTPSAPTPDPYAELINSIYNSNINDLNNQQNTLQNNQTSILGDINSQADTSKGTLTSNLGQSQAQIDQSAQQGEQRHADALTAARRLYQELVQGGQQRFGGASSAGEAYSA